MVDLPKIGDSIPVEKFFVSKMNMRVDEEFGRSMEDTVLTEHLGKTSIVQPFIARPESKGFGVVIGRRRFLAKRRAGAKRFVVGVDCLIKEMSDEEAFDASIRENLDAFRKEVNPVLRAKSIKRLLDLHGWSERQLANRWRAPVANVTEWLSPLRLVKALQTLMESGVLGYTDGLKVARLRLDEDAQNKLAKVLSEQGVEAFRSELARLQVGKGKRGPPKGKFAIARPTWNITEPEEQDVYRRLEVLANTIHKSLNEYCKMILTEHALGKR